jgi:hypothetical protein
VARRSKVTQDKAGTITRFCFCYGGEGEIRTVPRLVESVSYRFRVAGRAIFAVAAVRHCPKLPKSPASLGRFVSCKTHARAAAPGRSQKLHFRIFSSASASRSCTNGIKNDVCYGFTLIQVRFSNFRSFRDPQQLSLVAGPFSDQPEIPRFAEAIKESLLPVSAIYGSNASGKTNAIRAVYFIAGAVSGSHSRWNPESPIPRMPFWGAEGLAKPSEFEIEFLADGVRYRYGFIINSVAVLEEWLHAYPRGKKQTWFRRVQGEAMTFSAKLAGENRTIESLTRKNSLFLSAAAQNNHEALSKPYLYISELLFVLSEDRGLFRQHTADLCKSPEYLAEVSKLISLADLGVTGVRLRSTRISDDEKELLDAVWESMDSKTRPPRHMLTDERFELRLLHRFGAEEVSFSSAEESQGTLAYLDILGPVVRSIKTGTPLFIDELDSSLHPLLSAHIVRMFNSPLTNPRRAQLIFNTHDTNLLSSGLLRRDQIWFSKRWQHRALSIKRLQA